MRKTACESSLKQIGSSIKMYLTDWQDTFPTNRAVYAGGKISRISHSVKLTPPQVYVKNGCADNLSWVEGLYKYMEPPTDNGGTIECGAWECDKASRDSFPKDSKTAFSTYALNRNLIERPEICVRTSDRLMLARELDRHANSILRPTNYSCGQPNTPPDTPFLTKSDSEMGQTNCKPHGEGSNILLVDGHVKWFPPSMFYNNHCQYDARDKQWWNAVTQGDPANRKTIAITP